MFFKSSRNILNLNGMVMIILGLIFIIFPEKFTLLTFPQTINNPVALEVGVISRIIMGAFSIYIGLVLYSSRKLIRSGAQKLLLVSSLGFFIIFCACVYVFIINNSIIHIIGLFIFPLLSLLSLYVATRKFQN